jgi:SNF2 family DNA or RNA helicase
MSNPRYTASKAIKLKKQKYDIPAPKGLAYKPFQLAGIEYAIDSANMRTLMADDMGLGKTVEAIGYLNFMSQPQRYLGLRILVICPAFLKKNWRCELKKWLTIPFSVGIATSKKPFPTEKIVVINYDILHIFKTELDSESWETLVIDEAHRLQTKDSRRSTMVFGGQLPSLSQIEVWRSLGYCIAPKNKAAPQSGWGTTIIDPAGKLPGAGVCKQYPGRRADKELKIVYKPLRSGASLLLTGTPAYNRPVNLWPLLRHLRPKTWTNFFYFAKRYCGARRNFFGWDFKGASNLKELEFKLRDSCMVRRLKADVDDQLPGKVISEVNFSLENVSNNARKTLMPEKGKEVLWNRGSVDFEEMASYRLATGLAKVPMVKDLIGSKLRDVKQLVVFAYHKEVTARLTAKFPGIAVSVVGSDSRTVREKRLAEFRHCKKRVLVGTMDSIGEGENFQFCNTAVFAELDWASEKLRQAEDRLLRIGQENTVYIYYTKLVGSLDDLMTSVASGKKTNLKILMGD